MSGAQKLKLNKKTLIVTGFAPPKIAGGPLQLYNLFSNIDGGDYCIFTSQKNFKNKDNKFGKKLGCNYYFFENQKKIGLFNFFSTIYRGVKVIRAEKIELIMGITDNGKSFLLTYIMAKLCRKPYCVYLLDIYKGNFFPPFWNLLSKHFEPMLFRHAKLIFTVNESFNSLYQATYPDLIKKLRIVHNCAISESYLSSEINDTPIPPFRIVYSGSIYWAQENSIIDLIEAVNEIEDVEVSLDIYSPYATEKIIDLANNSDRVNVKALSPADVPRTQAQASILFLPLAWDTPSDLVIKTAIPGKLTGYLLSGRPILIHAPADCYLNKYAEENGFALVVGKKDKEELKRAIKKLILDKDYSDELVKKARKTFWANHDAVKNAELLVNYITDLPF